MRIQYPFHPQFGESVQVVGQPQHGGTLHFTIVQPDKTLCVIPAWMTDDGAARATTKDTPAISISALQDLRVIVDRLLSFGDGDSTPTKGGQYETKPTASSVAPVRARNDNKLHSAGTSAKIATANHCASERSNRLKRDSNCDGGE